MLDFGKYVLLGLIQGLTEFLPVSSSGHLLIFEKLFGFDESKFPTFAVLLHVATALAVIVYFSKYIGIQFANLFKSTAKLAKTDPKYIEIANTRSLWINWLVATSVLVLLLPFKHLIESYNQWDYALLSTGIILCITATLMIVLDRIPTEDAVDQRQFPWWKALLVGLTQDLSAIFRGLSRSGSTVFMSVFLGLKRPEAAKFSFLLSLPAIAAALLSDIKNIQAIPSDTLISTIAGCLTAFIAGMIGIHYLLKLLAKAQTKWFGFWCILIAGIAFGTFFQKYF